MTAGHLEPRSHALRSCSAQARCPAPCAGAAAAASAAGILNLNRHRCGSTAAQISEARVYHGYGDSALADYPVRFRRDGECGHSVVGDSLALGGYDGARDATVNKLQKGKAATPPAETTQHNMHTSPATRAWVSQVSPRDT